MSLDHVRPVLAEALREFIAALGGAAKVFMYHLGLHFGREIAAALSAVRHREVVERPLLILRGSGLGRGELVEYAWRERCVIRARPVRVRWPEDWRACEASASSRPSAWPWETGTASS